MGQPSEARRKVGAAVGSGGTGLDALGPALLVGPGARVLLVGTVDKPSVETALMDLAAALIEHAEAPPEHVRVMLNPPGAAEMENAVAGIAAEATEVLVIHYIGSAQHGLAGELCLAVGPASQAAIPCSRVLDLAREHGVRTTILILDCATGDQAQPPAGTQEHDLIIPDAAANEFLLVSITPNQSSQVSPTLTDSLISLLRSGDPSRQPNLTLHDLYQHATVTCPSNDNGGSYDDLTGRLVWARNPVYPMSQSRRPGRQILLAVVCVMALVVAGGIWLWPQQAAGPMSAQARSAALVTDSEALRATDPGMAAQLAVAAYRDSLTAQAADQLYSLQNTPLDGVVDDTGSAVERVAAAPDAALIAASDHDKTTRIWTIRDPAAPVLDATIKAGGAAVAIAPHGTELAAACGTVAAVCLWSLANVHRPTVVAMLPRGAGHPNGYSHIASIAISQDGDLLAAAAEQGFTLLWSIADPAHPRFLTELPNSTSDDIAISAVAFAPHGHLLAQTILRGRTTLWNIGDPTNPARVATLQTGYAAIAFSPDSNLLAAVGDTNVGLWNVNQPTNPAPITVTPAAATVNDIDLGTVAFSADGSRLAFAGITGLDKAGTPTGMGELCEVNVYPADLRPQGTFGGCWATGFGIFTMAATANGALFTGGSDGVVRLWRSALTQVDGVAATNHHTWSTSPTGHLLAAPIETPNSQPTSTGIWDISAPGIRPLDATVPSPANMITFLTSTTLLTATNDGVVRLWDLTDPHHPVQASELGRAELPSSAPGWPLPAAISQDTAGNLVAILDRTGVLHLWRIASASKAIEVASIRPDNDLTGPSGVLPDGRTAWLTTSAGIDWWDISNPAHPVHRGTSPFAGTNSITAATTLLVLGRPNSGGGTTLDPMPRSLS